MKNIFTLLSFSALALPLSAQNYCGSARYDSEVFSNVTITSDVTYGSNTNVNNATVTLKMDIYEPSGDTASIRPLIVFAHGGSFLGGSKTDQDQVDLCTHFAKRGYITATIDYRTGIGFPINEGNAKKAVWRATQDMKAAVRFFRQDAATSNTYKIDPNMIFVGGTSAGAFMALHLAYLDQPSEVPTEIDTTQLGGLEGNSGNPGYPSTANAVINLCGALGDADYMVPGDIPVVSLHGTVDETVPYATEMLYILGSFQIMVVDGSRTIHEHADSINVPNAFYTWYNKDHVPYAGTSTSAIAHMDTTVRFVSNFLYQQLSCTPTDPNPLPNAPAYDNVGIEDLSSNSGNNLFPNPSSGSVILYRNGDKSDATIMFIDIAGRTIKQGNISGEYAQLNVSDLVAGTYFLRVINEKGTSVYMLVKE
jgi:para-nitrobenzyl esterase